MPWEEVNKMSLREEFATFALSKSVPLVELCRRYNISRPTGYKWICRYKCQGREGLLDRSHRPMRIRGHISPAIEREIISLRKEIPDWGARKILAQLRTKGIRSVPTERTITNVLRRNGLIQQGTKPRQEKWKRFERPVPNSLWQMDFKGKVMTLEGWVHPLTVLDDHSRFSICLKAMPNEQGIGVKDVLTTTFQRYGLPDTILADNGSPWGNTPDRPLTWLSVWLMRLGIRVTHSRPAHPQTMGKDERFHRTLNQELLRHYQWRGLAHMQSAFDPWRDRYNYRRPHDSLGVEVPAEHYQPSLRTYPEKLPEPEYNGMEIRGVDVSGRLSYKGKAWKVSYAFAGQKVGIRPDETDGLLDVFFFHNKIKQLDLRA